MILKEKRIEKGLTQKEVGIKCGLSCQAISAYEKGKRDPNTETLRTLSKLYDCTIDELIGNEGEDD